MKSSSKPFDPVVKLGLGVLVGSFLLIGIGMFLSRPDRSIPPYSLGSQEEEVVVIHVPSWTSDPEIKALLFRFRSIGESTRDFGPLKIRPTTPLSPESPYETMTVFVVANPDWATPEALHRYLTSSLNGPEENSWRKGFERAVRGGFILNQDEQKGWLGPVPQKKSQPGDPDYQILFQDAMTP